MAKQDRGLKLLEKIENKDIDGVKQILKFDVDLTVDKKGDTPIHLAARKGYLDILQLLVDNGCDVNQKNQNGFAALHYAAREGDMDIVHFLLKCGAKPNIQNMEGDAPIHELVKFQPMDTIEEMVRLGMDVNLQNKLGRTPLHVAAAHNRQEAMEILLTCGANSNQKDENGRTAADFCKNPQITEMIKLHSLTMEAMKKGVVRAQGISVKRQNAKKQIRLQRVGVAIERIALTTGVTASFYVRREKSENCSFSFSTEKGDEMLSDVFLIKITNVSKISDVTLTVPIYGMPSEKEDLFVRFDAGAKLKVTETKSTEEEIFCTFETKLTPDCFSVFALFTCTKTDVKQVGQEGGVVTTDADQEMKLEVPSDTFSQDTNITIQVFPVECNVEQTSTDTVLTDVYNLNADNFTNKNNMKLTIPLHQTVADGESVALVTAEEVTDDTDENCLALIDTLPRIENKKLVYEIPHFSIHVAVARTQFETNKKDIYDRLVRATERQRSAVFFVVVRYEKNISPIIVVECSMQDKSSKRIQKWIDKGYKSQSPEQSGTFLLRPYEEFSVSFRGALPDEPNDGRKLAFLPRRASFQPYRITTFTEGSVVIQKTCKDQEKLGSGEIITVLPFNIKVEEEKGSVPESELLQTERNDQVEDEDKQGLTCSKNEEISEKCDNRKQRTGKQQNKDNPQEPCIEGRFSPNEHNDQFEDKQGLACSKNEGIFEKSEKRKQKSVKEQNKDNPKEPCVEEIRGPQPWLFPSYLKIPDWQK